MSEVSLYIPGEHYTSVRASPQLLGYEKELELIKKVIRDIEQSYIVFIVGRGGIGKTRLVSHIINHPPDDIQLTLASEVIDLYHTHVHSLAGFIGGILGVVSPLASYFREVLEETGADKLEEVARAEQEGFSLAEIISRRQELTEFFIEAFNRFSSKQRVVLALDTVERLQVTDPTGGLLTSSQQHRGIFNWIIEDFLPHLDNVVILLSGRPEGERLSQSLKQVEGKQFQLIRLLGLSEQAALSYFNAVGEEAESSNDPATAMAIAKISEEERRTIFYCLCDQNYQSVTVRPLLLALAIDYLVMEGRILPALTRPLNEARSLTSDERRVIRNELGRALVRSIREYRRPADQVLLALAWLPKGANPELLARVTGLDNRETQGALQEIRDLSFVKIRPADNRVFLHDEMYDLLQNYALDAVSPPRREYIYSAILEYYDHQINVARAKIADLYAPTDVTAVPNLGQVLLTKTHLRDALVEDLYYRLQWNADQGFQAYFRYSQMALRAYDESLDIQLRTELLRFLAERDPSGNAETIDGLDRSDVVADVAVGQIKWLINYGQANEALEVAQHLRTDSGSLIVGGRDLIEAEVSVWEALALVWTGDYVKAEQLLHNAVDKLKELPRSVRWAGVLASAYAHLGYIHRSQGRYYAAVSEYGKALPLWRATEIEVEQANTLNNRAFVLAEAGMLDAAWQQAWDAFELRMRLGPRIPVGLSLNTLARIKIRDNDLEGARVFAERALTLFDVLGSSRGRGLALMTLAEAERRISDWAPYFPTRTLEWLEKAARHAEEASRIFGREVYEPAQQVRALIEVGCTFRDWAKVRRDYPDIMANEEKKSSRRSYGVLELMERAQRALEEAADLAERHGILYSQVEARVNLAWLFYYVELHTGAADLDTARAKREVLHKIGETIPAAYKITERHTTSGEPRGGLPPLTRESVIVPFLLQLGKLELLYGQIAFNRFMQSSKQDIDALKEAVQHYTLSLAYDTLFSDQVWGDMRRGMDRIYEHLKRLNIRELKTVYDAVAETEQRYDLPQSRMMRSLEHLFGPRELLAEL